MWRLVPLNYIKHEGATMAMEHATKIMQRFQKKRNLKEG
jgi:hypothetical protein